LVWCEVLTQQTNHRDRPINRILFANSLLREHIAQVTHAPDAYRPEACPHCGVADPWLHGVYMRKADRDATGDECLNPVPVARFRCSACGRTCSRLPLSIAPRRWYNWEMQQCVLLWLLSGHSVHQASWWGGPSRSTVLRWREWLRCRSEQFMFHLRSRFPELGRIDEGWEAFWRNCLDQMPLCQAMAWLDRELTVP
jgi:transposase-like protein